MSADPHYAWPDRADTVSVDPATRATVALWSQVLLQAIREAGGNVHGAYTKVTSLRLQRVALNWIFNPPEPGVWNTFDALCQLFDWDPDNIRMRLARQPDIACALKKFKIAR